MPHDVEVIATMLESPWEREVRAAARTAPWAAPVLGAEVDQRALHLSAAATYALDTHAAIPEFVPDDVSEAFDCLIHDRTIRVDADLTWSLEDVR